MAKVHVYTQDPEFLATLEEGRKVKEAVAKFAKRLKFNKSSEAVWDAHTKLSDALRLEGQAYSMRERTNGGVK